MYIGKGSETEYLNPEQLNSLCAEGLKSRNLANKKVLAIIPDTTRSGPTDLIFKSIYKNLKNVAEKIDFLIALGTHPVMEEERVNDFLKITASERKGEYKDTKIFQHHWDDPKSLTHIGTISASKIGEISGGLLKEEIPVTVNKAVLDYDEILLVGPIFPHEVVGFSGGYKYLFPGISGPDFLHRFHWLGALITNPKINGTKDTPVREALNVASTFITKPLTQICYVVKDGQVHGFYTGDRDAWSEAADLSSKLNVKYVAQPFKTILSIAPLMYEDLWTAGKCMYKLEPIVADNGQLIIYAPHVKEVSHTHGKEIEKVGYHTRDYFLKQMDKFTDVTGCIMAHSTHVKGIGTFANGIEKPRVEVVLATGIPETICKKINLGYIDYKSVDISEYQKREDTFVVERAGEVLYRLEGDRVPDIDNL